MKFVFRSLNGVLAVAFEIRRGALGNQSSDTIHLFIFVSIELQVGEKNLTIRTRVPKTVTIVKDCKLTRKPCTT